MKKLATLIKRLRLNQILSVFLVGVLMFVSTACSNNPTSAGTRAGDRDSLIGKRASEIREEVPNKVTDNRFQSGMNDYSDVDPRFNERSIQGSAKALKENAERNVIDMTDDVGTNTKRILGKKGENAEQFGQRAKADTETLGDKAQRGTGELLERTQKGTENLKANTRNAAQQTQQAAEDTAADVKSSARGTASNLKAGANTASNRTSETAQRVSDKAANAIKDRA